MSKFLRLMLCTILAVHCLQCTTGSATDAIVADNSAYGVRTDWMEEGERLVEMTADGKKRPLRLAPAKFSPQP